MIEQALPSRIIELGSSMMKGRIQPKRCAAGASTQTTKFDMHELDSHHDCSSLSGGIFGHVLPTQRHSVGWVAVQEDRDSVNSAVRIARLRGDGTTRTEDARRFDLCPVPGRARASAAWAGGYPRLDPPAR